MIYKHRVITVIIFLLILAEFFLAYPVQAQTPEPPPGGDKPKRSSLVFLGLPDTHFFPRITAFLEPQIPGINKLNPSDLIVTEDDKPIQGADIKIIKPGMQLVVAINPNEMFLLRDMRGRSRYDNILQAIQHWVGVQPAPKSYINKAQPENLNDLSKMNGEDDLSLISANGVEITHVPTYADWLKGFNDLPMDKPFKLNFDILVKAIDIATEKSPRDGMGRAVFLITAPPDKDDASAFDNLITRANEQRVHVFVWMIASPGYFTSQGAQGLVNLATKTGGKIFMFSGEETIPNPDSYFNPLRDIYLLSYESQIRNTGDHKTQVQVSAVNQVFPSDLRSFYLTLAPPQPMFISPPREIIRSEQAESAQDVSSDQKTGDKAVRKILPEQIKLSILVDFPDTFRRSLKYSALYVDGQLTQENKQPPFDSFMWDLTKYPGGGEHLIQVEVLDQLDLTNVSIETPIRIKIHSEQQSLTGFIGKQGKFIALIAILLAGFLLLWALVLGGRLHPKTFFIETRQKISNHRYLDPVTQPVHIRSEPVTRPRVMSIETKSQPIPGMSNQARRDENSSQPLGANVYSRIPESESRFNLPWQNRREDTHERAYLIRLIEVPGNTETREDTKPYTIVARDIIIGSNPLKASLVIEDSSVEGMHARLSHLEDGSYSIADIGSTAGTWVNYAPISQDGTSLEHGDLLHIGRIGFRFVRTISVNPPTRTIVSKHANRN